MFWIFDSLAVLQEPSHNMETRVCQLYGGGHPRETLRRNDGSFQCSRVQHETQVRNPRDTLGKEMAHFIVVESNHEQRKIVFEKILNFKVFIMQGKTSS